MDPSLELRVAKEGADYDGCEAHTPATVRQMLEENYIGRKFRKFVPITIAAIFLLLLFVGLIFLAVASVSYDVPLALNASTIIVLTGLLLANFIWLTYAKRLPLTRTQNVVAGTFLYPVCWIPPKIVTNIPIEHAVLLALATPIIGLMWLLGTVVHRRFFRRKIAHNIAIASELNDPDHPDIRRLSNNTALPSAIFLWGAGSSTIFSTVLVNWQVTNILANQTLVAMAWGMSVTVGLLFYNLLPRQFEIREFIKESREDSQTQ